MTKAHRQEALSRAYVQAVAAVAGFTVSSDESDYGLDMALRQVYLNDAGVFESGDTIDVQLKSTTRPVVTADAVVYDLDTRAYRILRNPDVITDRILVLHVIPTDTATWLGQTAEGLTIAGCAYWLSLRGLPPRSATRSVRVRIPRTNVVSPAFLQSFFE